MKTYEETIERLAQMVYHNCMGGEFNPYYGIDFSMVSFIYRKTPRKVVSDVDKIWKKL